jgi:hypothetical protein
VGVEGEPPRRPAPGGDGGGLTPFQRGFVGAVIGVLYALGMTARGHVAAGVVGGILAAIVCYLALTRYAENRRRR